MHSCEIADIENVQHLEILNIVSIKLFLRYLDLVRDLIPIGIHYDVIIKCQGVSYYYQSGNDLKIKCDVNSPRTPNRELMMSAGALGVLPMMVPAGPL